MTEKLQARIKTIIPTHFHEDYVAGLEIFRKKQIPVFASRRTIDLLEKETAFIQIFADSLALSIGNKKFMQPILVKDIQKTKSQAIFLLILPCLAAVSSKQPVPVKEILPMPM